MKRDLAALANERFDLVIVGGGIYGACVAREAALRGLAVALVEKDDFGGATSAASQRIIHGGLRYLQHGDVRRSRESVREQRTLLRIAPHLVRPLPVLVPGYGHGLKGREALALGVELGRVVGLGCDRPASAHTRLPPSRVLSRREVLDLAPSLDAKGLTGGVLFHDAQVERSERLLLAFLRAAESRGARLANHLEVVGLHRRGGRVEGVEAEDRLGGGRLEIRATVTVNAAGPWIERVSGLGADTPAALRFPLARGLNLVTSRPLFEGGIAVGFYARGGYRDRAAILDRGQRLLFATPWRSGSIVGTAFGEHTGGPDQSRADEGEIEALLHDVDAACPALGLARNDVATALAGLVPSDGVDGRSGDVQVAKHYRIVDHTRFGAPGLLSVVGVKYTTARDVAERTLVEVFRVLGARPPQVGTSALPLPGGDLEDVDSFVSAAAARHGGELPRGVVEQLVRSYGSLWEEVLAYLSPADAGETVERRILRAEVRHAVREEMALTLDDCLRLRTGHAAGGRPAEDVVRTAAATMAEELGWSPARTGGDIAALLP